MTQDIHARIEQLAAELGIEFTSYNFEPISGATSDACCGCGTCHDEAVDEMAGFPTAGEVSFADNPVEALRALRARALSGESEVEVFIIGEDGQMAPVGGGIEEMIARMVADGALDAHVDLDLEHLMTTAWLAGHAHAHIEGFIEDFGVAQDVAGDYAADMLDSFDPADLVELTTNELNLVFSNNPSDAWSMHCNVALALTEGGVPSAQANNLANAVMGRLFGVSTMPTPQVPSAE